MLVFHIPDLMERFSGNLMQVTAPVSLCVGETQGAEIPTFEIVHVCFDTLPLDLRERPRIVLISSLLS
jgi:hypothetical protein